MLMPSSRWPGGLIALMMILPSALTAEPEAPPASTQIEELLSDVNRTDGPGAAIAIIKNGEFVYKNAFGMADLERGVALTPRSVFEIGSVSKQFTAMSILLLENDGKLSLDDDIREYLPEMPAYEGPITLRHLLHHTSGIRDIETLFPLAGWPYANYYSTAQQLELISRQQKLNFEPGSEHLYSNSGYLLLAYIVERVTGDSLREFADKRIFQPLGMRQTVFYDTPEQIVPDRAIPYSPAADGGYQMELWFLPFAGPSGLYTSLEDLARWDANFYDNQLGGGAELIERMVTPGTLDNGEATQYAAGLFVGGTDGDHRVINHGGAWMGYRASLARYPDQRLTVILLSNASDIQVSTRAIASLFLEAESESPEEDDAESKPPATIEVSSEALAQHEGTYWNESEMLLRTIEVREGALHYVRGGGSSTELGAIKNDRFIMLGIGVQVDIEFAKDEKNGSPAMTVTVEDQDALEFRRIEALPTDTLAEYEGAYWSDDLARELQLHVEDGQIQLSWADEDRQVAALQIGPDDLLARAFVPVPWDQQDVRILIERDDADQVKGLDLSCNMVRNLSFVKKAP